MLNFFNPELNDIWLKTLAWVPSDLQQEQFQQLYELIIAGNQQFNLTRITDPQEFWEKHLWDSLRAIKSLLNLGVNGYAPQIIDIGSGAGFPGFPVAISLPNSTVTLLDSTRKKTAFLEKIGPQINLHNTQVITGRAEKINQLRAYKHSYDLALIRAVASAPICAEYTLPFLKKDGLAILYRGQWSAEEHRDLEKILAKIGGYIESIDSFSTPLSQGLRNCLYLRKIDTIK
jgi:16S rRNA (guanine527-N7)-methyltransferase